VQVAGGEAPSASFAGDTVQVDTRGGEGSDTVTYARTASNDNIGVANDSTAVTAFAVGTANSPQNTFGVENLDVQGLGGNDTITAGNGLAALTNLTIDGGASGDTITGGDGDDTIIGGSGNDSVAGGRGADVTLLGSGADKLHLEPR
jgi:Ca2+-binding RTX toxin-like protein